MTVWGKTEEEENYRKGEGVRPIAKREKIKQQAKTRVIYDREGSAKGSGNLVKEEGQKLKEKVILMLKSSGKIRQNSRASRQTRKTLRARL